MQNVSSKFPGVGDPASPEMVGLGDPGAMTRVRPGANDEVPKPRLLNRVHWIQRLDKSLSLLRLDVYLTCNETMLTHLTHDCGESAV